ncbi:MAG TPA: CDC48 family AAA ATPase [Candidatus Tectomicrobia bacterium]|nr:CDC48 family AAA ATPase [Candidatus Tectomicrobia bacterium]
MATQEEGRKSLVLRVIDARPEDIGRGIAKLAPEDLEMLGLAIGDMISLMGKRRTVAKAMRTYVKDTNKGFIALDQVLRANAQTALAEQVTLQKIEVQTAQRVVLSPLNAVPAKVGDDELKELLRLLEGLPVVGGDKVRPNAAGFKNWELSVVETVPEGAVIIRTGTTLTVKPAEATAQGPRKVTYKDIGGMSAELQQVREVVELPLRYPQLFDRLGIEAPKGVLLFGPPGCGKTMTARAVASETSAHFIHISGPEIVHRYYGDSEAHLREVFKEARDRAPTIIFFDEIDAIASKREDVSGDVEKRIVAQLMALLDGLESRGQVIVVAATNIPDSVDPALRRPGRFDREISVRVPDREGRLEILRIHTRTMPLSKDVDLVKIADATHGYVGADLKALCQEAAMITLRRLVPDFDAEQGITEEMLEGLEVGNGPFAEAMKRVKPSTGREVFRDVADVRWNDVGGLDDAKQVLREAIEWPLRHGDLFLQVGTTPPKGILLSGFPGSGKTLLAKAVAKESGVNFIAVKGPELLSKWVGESEQSVREVFRKARLAAPCIIFFDEIDALCPVRGSGSSDSGVGDRIVSQFLTEMDGIEELKGVVVLGATNRLDMVDPALLSPGRFDLVVDLPVPDRAARRAIFAVHTQGKPLAPDVDVDTLAGLTEGLVGGDIASICRRATMHAIRDYVEQQGGAQQGVLLSARHFQPAVEAVMKASQHARAQRLLRELTTAERPPVDQQQTLSEAKPGPQRTAPLA